MEKREQKNQEKQWIQKGNANDPREICLTNLGVSSTEDINNWFRKSYANGYRIDRLHEAAAMILGRRWETVAIIGDYDADGVTATSILLRALQHMGIMAQWRIPKRMTEGFGLNETIVREIPDGKNVLIITVDNGIAALEAVKLAKRHGFTVIVTDHHDPVVGENGKAILPCADIIIDPEAIPGSADYQHYCGAGLAYRLARELFLMAGKTQAQDVAVLAGLETLAAVGTICDIVELHEENYVIARNGLIKIGKGYAPVGLKALLEGNKVNGKPTAYDIGFKAGPCLNANGRIIDDGAIESVKLLITEDAVEAGKLAETAISNNTKRKAMEQAAVTKAEKENQDLGNAIPECVYIEGVCEGIVGLVAGRFSKKYGVPVIVLTDAQDGDLKGSGRAPDGYDLLDIVSANQNWFTKFGGHPGAVGVSLKKDDFQSMKKALQAYGEKQRKINTNNVSTYDLEIQADDVPMATDLFTKFEPFGKGNPTPICKVTGFSLRPMSNGYGMGEGQEYRKNIGASGIKLKSRSCEAIGFGMAERMLGKEYAPGTLTLYGTLSYNVFRGISTPQVRFEDFEEEKS